MSQAGLNGATRKRFYVKIEKQTMFIIIWEISTEWEAIILKQTNIGQFKQSITINNVIIQLCKCSKTVILILVTTTIL